MTFITAACLFDTGILNAIKTRLSRINKVFVEIGYLRAINELEREGFKTEARNLRNQIKLGGIK